MSKEKKTELTGALTWSVLEGGMEVFAFPQLYSLPPPFDVVPPLDKGLVPATGAVVMAVGEHRRKPKTVLFGRGAAVYGMGAFINELSRRVLLRNLGQFRVRYGARARVPFNGRLGYGSSGKYGLRTAPSGVVRSGGAGKYGNSAPLSAARVVPWNYRPR